MIKLSRMIMKVGGMTYDDDDGDDDDSLLSLDLQPLLREAEGIR